VTTHGHVAGSQRRTIESLREANAGLCRELEEAKVLLASRAFELGELKARVEKVLALHRHTPEMQWGNVCCHCFKDWPCPTLRILDGGDK